MDWADMIFVKSFTPFSKLKKLTCKKRVNRDILNLKYDGFGVSIHILGIISQVLCVHAHFMFYQWAQFDIIQLYLKHTQGEILSEW